MSYWRVIWLICFLCLLKGEVLCVEPLRLSEIMLFRNNPTDPVIVELQNIAEEPLDISNYSIADALKTQYVIPEGTIVPARGMVVVVFGEEKTDPLYSHSETILLFTGKELGERFFKDPFFNGCSIYASSPLTDEAMIQQLGWGMRSTFSSGYIGDTVSAPSCNYREGTLLETVPLCISNPSTFIMLGGDATLQTIPDGPLRKKMHYKTWSLGGPVTLGFPNPVPPPYRVKDTKANFSAKDLKETLAYCFLWYTSMRDGMHRLQIATDPKFLHIKFDEVVHGATYRNEVPFGEILTGADRYLYYWRVRYEEAGEISDWSDTATIDINIIEDEE